MKRVLFASQEVSEVAKQSTGKIVKVYSFFPIDRADCVCQKAVLEWRKKLAEATDAQRHQLMEETPFFVCPRDKSNMQRYKIVCNNCGDIQGYVWASDPSLIDWCDFHYLQWTKGDRWRGCFTPHISPVTERLCFECCCGNDTRDFRANMTLNQKVAERMERENSKGRELDRDDSKFKATQVKANVVV